MDNAPNVMFPLTTLVNTDHSHPAYKVQHLTYIVWLMRRFVCSMRPVETWDSSPCTIPSGNLLPLTNVFVSITPDVLHQLLQGVIKHLLNWLICIFGPIEIDVWCHAMLPNHKLMIFSKGISTLSYISGHEHKKICSILLGLVVDLPIPGQWDSSWLVHTVHVLLDFLFLTQYQCHTSKTINQLQQALLAFHSHKAIFRDLGIREHFNIPKLHSLMHYILSIHLFGTTDNYNTKQTKRLHIDFAKKAYRATN